RLWLALSLFLRIGTRDFGLGSRASIGLWRQFAIHTSVFSLACFHRGPSNPLFRLDVFLLVRANRIESLKKHFSQNTGGRTELSISTTLKVGVSTRSLPKRGFIQRRGFRNRRPRIHHAPSLALDFHVRESHSRLYQRELDLVWLKRRERLQNLSRDR